jgi:hypothetical protein
MKLSDFKIGERFWCSGKQYQCTDIGTRVVVAVRIDQIEVVCVDLHAQDGCRIKVISQDQAKEEGWLNGPPYALAEHVFDEHDLPVCSTQPE